MLAQNNCFILGSTGETGKELLKILAGSNEFDKIIAINRKHVQYGEQSSKIEQRLVDFNDLQNYQEMFMGGKTAFCCIGTTLSKSSKEEFEFVERDLIYNAAKLLRLHGCTRFHLVSGFASNPNSWFFIPRVKGECEKLIMELRFHQVFVYRPGLLRCARAESRPLEYLARSVSNFLDFCDWWSISTANLAQVILECSRSSGEGGNQVKILEHQNIVQIFREVKSAVRTFFENLFTPNWKPIFGFSHSKKINFGNGGEFNHDLQINIGPQPIFRSEDLVTHSRQILGENDIETSQQHYQHHSSPKSKFQKNLI